MNVLTYLLVMCIIIGIGVPCFTSHCMQSRCTPLNDSMCRDVPLTERIIRTIISGHRRLSEKGVLEHEKRGTVYDLILQIPGIDLKTLVAYSRLNENTLRYHLSLLEKSHKIRITNEGGALHFFENHGRFSDHEQRVLSIQFSSRTSRILMAISETPGISRGDLADTLGIAGSSVTKQIQKLITEGFVSPKKDGKYTRYYLMDISSRFPEKISTLNLIPCPLIRKEHPHTMNGAK